MFKPIESNRLSDGAVDQIVGAIEIGILRIGDRIPSERDLMRQLGVGRASVREALRQLEAMGIIEVRAGQGAVVVNTGTRAPASQLWKSWLRVHNHEVLQLLDVREALEVKAAELAAEHIDEEHARQLQDAVSRLERTIPDGAPNDRAEADVAFHTALAEASGNDMLLTLAQSLMYALHEARLAAYASPERAQLSLVEHAAIMQTVTNRNPDQARAAMIHHLRTSKEFLSNADN